MPAAPDAAFEQHVMRRGRRQPTITPGHFSQSIPNLKGRLTFIMLSNSAF